MSNIRNDLYDILKKVGNELKSDEAQKTEGELTIIGKKPTSHENSLRRKKSIAESSRKEPMIEVLRKMQAGKQLTYRELRKWTLHNSRVLPASDVAHVRRRETRYFLLTLFTCITAPPLVLVLYSFSKRLQSNPLRSKFSAIFNAGCIGITFCWVALLAFNYNSSVDAYKLVYGKYKDYVLRPEFMAQKVTLRSKKYEEPQTKFASPSLLEMQWTISSQLKGSGSKFF
eukprot:TRINITY_DN9638_c0_g1_i5.p1 TRINITY_DN9638_c0_g1~~TRINITY_DN9638_c0_g1_i5.p1  ORF type:complete len:255 (+),score=62.52 TRINITY_DN9638_c0_g1_i5:84-767(+)